MGRKSSCYSAWWQCKPCSACLTGRLARWLPQGGSPVCLQALPRVPPAQLWGWALNYATRCHLLASGWVLLVRLARQEQAAAKRLVQPLPREPKKTPPTSPSFPLPLKSPPRPCLPQGQVGPPPPLQTPLLLQDLREVRQEAYRRQQVVPQQPVPPPPHPHLLGLLLRPRPPQQDRQEWSLRAQRREPRPPLKRLIQQPAQSLMQADFPIPPQRSIPTCVGSIPPARRGLPNRPVHPHVRGEHDSLSETAVLDVGPSPRAWGAYLIQQAGFWPVRSIPTCVGSMLEEATHER
ncbi:hypothetical protein Tfu_1325 [Thermobifida fusca YX]|nr:hypothetical protein Tfu_1325 [Thermobifida fusca YX]